jgi:hypothetical protein
VLAARRGVLFSSAEDAIATCRRLASLKVSVHLVELGADVTEAFAGLAECGDAVAAGLAEVELEFIRRRDLRCRGIYRGGRLPFCTRLETRFEGGRAVTYVVDDARQRQAVAMARELHGGGASLRAIAAAVRSTLGVAISHETVRAIARDAGEVERAV